MKATIAIVTCLTLSGCVELLQGNAEDALTFTVPTSNIGDVVQYQWRTVGENGHKGEWFPSLIFKIVGQGPTVDHTGRTVNAVQLLIDEPHMHERDGQPIEANITTDLYLDPASRLPIRIDFDHRADFDNLLLEQTAIRLDAFQPQNVRLHGLAWQGTTLTEISALSSMLPSLETSPMTSSGGGGGGGAFSMAGRYMATEHMTEFGWEPRTGPATMSWSWEEARVGSRLLVEDDWMLPVLTKHTGITSAEWFSPDSPYPRVVHRGYEGYSGRSTAEYSVLHETRGTEPVRWETQVGPVPDLARSPPDQRFPADGTADLEYPLSEAVEDAESSVPVLAWRSANPEALLVSAWLQHGRFDDDQRESWVWQLAWAEPQGNGRVVSVERFDPDFPVAIVEDHGDIQFDAFTMEDLPAAPITIGAVADLWRQVDPSSADAPVDHVRWGFVLDWKAAPPCVGGVYSPGRSYPVTQLTSLVVGSYNGGSCLDAEHDLRSSFLAAQTEEGVLFAGHLGRVLWR